MAVSALAGGIARLVTAALTPGERKEGWWWKSFAGGLLPGAIGGGIGFSVMDFLSADGFLHGLFAPNEAPVPPLIAPGPEADVTSGAALVEVAASGALPTGLEGVLTVDQFAALSPELQALANAGDPASMVEFSKEASFHLLNHAGGDEAARRAGAALIQRGLEVAQQGDVHNIFTRMLAADMAYIRGAREFVGLIPQPH